MAGNSNPLSKTTVDKIFGLSCLHPYIYFIFDGILLIGCAN
jgi:hypothetical protein